MDIVPEWYEPTLRDRMFLVEKGVPYETALAMTRGQFLKTAYAFASLANGVWIHPYNRTILGRESLKEQLVAIGTKFQGAKRNEETRAFVQEVMQDLSFCLCGAEIRQVQFEEILSVKVHHPDEMIIVAVRKTTTSVQ